MIPKKSIQLHNFFPHYFYQNKLSKNVSSFLLIHFFKKWINMKTKITINAILIQIQSLDIIRTFVPRTRTKAEVTKEGCEEIDNDALPSSWTL